MATPAFAADAGVYSPWAGFYAGVVYGAGASTVNSSQTASHSVTGWGQTSGALVGYDFQSGGYVYGAEGELSFHLLRPDDPGVPGLTAHVVDTPVTDRLRLRLGYDAGAFLPFVAVGLASARIYEAGDAWPAVQYGQTHQALGLSIGAGLEWRFAAPFLGPLVVRGEYVLDAYPSQSYAVFPKPAQPIRTSAIEQFVRVGVIDYIDPAWRPTADAGAFDWSGAYGGALAGALWAQPRTTLSGTATTTTDSVAGPVAGLFTGRNLMFGPWMLGWEGVVEATNATGTGPQPSVAAVSYRNYFEADARLRAGYAVGRFLPYVTAGLGYGRSEQTDLSPTSGSYRGRIPSESAVAGAGLEYGFDDRWTARLEYLYEWSIGSEWTRLDAGIPLVLDQTRPAQTLRAGLAYYFH